MEKAVKLKNIITGAAAAFLVFGSVGTSTVGATAATISNTGPDSRNEINFSNKLDCEINNDNNISITNNNKQLAITGFAEVGGWMNQWDKWNPEKWQGSFDSWLDGFNNWFSTSATPWTVDHESDGWGGGDSWSGYDPTLWKDHGRSFDDWNSQFRGYMDKQHEDWKNNWKGGGGGNTTAGDAVTGDATNISNTSYNVSIKNTGCFEKVVKEHQQEIIPGRGGQIPTAVIPSQAGGVGGGAGPSVAGEVGGFGGFGGFGGGVAAAPAAQAAVPSVSAPSGRGAAEVKKPVKQDIANISNTGPDSKNEIEFASKAYINVNNNNNVCITNNNPQTAVSGDAEVSGNTTGGDAQTGSAENQSDLSATVSITN